MKAKMTVYKGGGKAPVASMGKKVVKYQMGGKPPIKPIVPDPRKKLAKEKGSDAYEARRQESRKEMEANANVVRRQSAINRANEVMASPAFSELQKQRAASPSYKTVSGQKQGISSAERAGASKGTVGSMTPSAAKRSEKNIKNPPVQAAPKRMPEPARAPGTLRPETIRAIELGFTPEANLRRAKMEDASMAANPRDAEVLRERAALKRAAAAAAQKKK
jgi:hypothetical protein